VKLDELIRISKGAHNALLDLEELDDVQLEAIREEYEEIAERARKALAKGRSDTDVPKLGARRRS
jgi:low affinity Fe/Cu permease